MKLETRSIPGFLKALNAAARAVLVHGADAGTVRDLGARLTKAG